MRDLATYVGVLLEQPSIDIAHIGKSQAESNDITPTGSGRYLVGSGETPYQHEYNVHNEYNRYNAMGYSDADIARVMGYKSVPALRAAVSASSEEYKNIRGAQFEALRAKGLSNSEIARQLGVSEGTVRNMVKKAEAGQSVRTTKLTNAKDMLRESVNSIDTDQPFSMIDVGEGTEMYMGFGQDTKNNALIALQEEGYVVTTIQVGQVGNSTNKTTVQVLAKVNDPEFVAEYGVSGKMNVKGEVVTAEQNALSKYAYSHLDEIQPVTSTICENEDGVEVARALEKPKQINIDRVMIADPLDPTPSGIFDPTTGKEYTMGEVNAAKDGTMILRPSAKDLTMTDEGNTKITHYAQVRIACTDGKGIDRYCKGMAMYGNEEDFPDGVDIIFYTNPGKVSADGKVYAESVLKKQKKEEMNPFGADLKASGQRHYIDSDGNEQLSAVNILREEGDWGNYSLSLPSQFLAKQNVPLVKEQLKATVQEKKDYIDTLSKISDPQVRNKLLEDFADSLDSQAIHLNAAGVSEQRTQVILPCTSLRGTEYNEDGSVKRYGEVYAPGYGDGQKVAIIRYPHANICELPILIVNNNNEEGRRTIGFGKDAIGLPKSALEQLSGADTDGDTGTVIPVSMLNNKGLTVDSKAYFKELVGFDAESTWPYVEGVTQKSKKWNGIDKEGKTMTKAERGQEMGLVTNLIMDMSTLGDAVSHDEHVRAIKYSMVAIDAYKHNIDWRQAKEDLNITGLYSKYSSTSRGGGMTLFTRAKSMKQDVPEYKEGAYVTDSKTGKTKKLLIDPETGEKLFTYTNGTHSKKVGETEDGKGIYDDSVREPNKVSVEKLRYAWMQGKGAASLASDNPSTKEQMYVEYSDTLHALANSVRRMLSDDSYHVIDSDGKTIKKVDSKTYREKAKQNATEEDADIIASLRAKLEVAKRNAPKERLAQVYANAAIKARLESNPSIKDDDDALKKLKNAELASARTRTGANGKGTRVVIDKREYEAINSGKVPKTLVADVLKKSDSESLSKCVSNASGTRQVLTASQIARIKAWAASDSRSTPYQMAKSLGVSVSTINKVISGEYEE